MADQPLQLSNVEREIEYQTKILKHLQEKQDTLQTVLNAQQRDIREIKRQVGCVYRVVIALVVLVGVYILFTVLTLLGALI